MSRKDAGNLSGKVVTDTVELDHEMARKGWRCSKGGSEAITGVDDGAIQLKEGDEGSSNVVEGWWMG